mmetsp:Transcript_76194/g.150694  ORF Transcript_76194/g.150694 Transcript_76194/m.150694 type:complete len:746 (+) Transcript_76194:62-2299(+)
MDEPPSRQNCVGFHPNPFKRERCRDCGRLWTEHGGLISEELAEEFRKAAAEKNPRKQRTFSRVPDTAKADSRSLEPSPRIAAPPGAAAQPQPEAAPQQKPAATLQEPARQTSTTQKEKAPSDAPAPPSAPGAGAQSQTEATPRQKLATKMPQEPSRQTSTTQKDKAASGAPTPPPAALLNTRRLNAGDRRARPLQLYKETTSKGTFGLSDRRASQQQATSKEEASTPPLEESAPTTPKTSWSRVGCFDEKVADCKAPVPIPLRTSSNQRTRVNDGKLQAPVPTSRTNSTQRTRDTDGKLQDGVEEWQSHGQQQDEWLFDGHAEETGIPSHPDSDTEDTAFRMIDAVDIDGPQLEKLQELQRSRSAEQPLKVVNLINFIECRQQDSDAAASAAGVTPRKTEERTLSALGISPIATKVQDWEALQATSPQEEVLLAEIQHLRLMLKDAQEEQKIQLSIVRDEVVERQRQISDLQALLKAANARCRSLAEQAVEERKEAGRLRAEAAKQQQRVAACRRDAGSRKTAEVEADRAAALPRAAADRAAAAADRAAFASVSSTLASRSTSDRTCMAAYTPQGAPRRISTPPLPPRNGAGSLMRGTGSPISASRPTTSHRSTSPFTTSLVEELRSFFSGGASAANSPAAANRTPRPRPPAGPSREPPKPGLPQASPGSNSSAPPTADGSQPDGEANMLPSSARPKQRAPGDASPKGSDHRKVPLHVARFSYSGGGPASPMSPGRVLQRYASTA